MLDGDHVGTGEAGALDEGTVVRIQVRRDGDRIAEARFKVFGCSGAIASASLVAEWLDGAAIDEALLVTPERVVQTLELAPERHHVARLAVDAGLKAVREVRSKKSEVGSTNDRDHGKRLARD